jgi:hypothetical protein
MRWRRAVGYDDKGTSKGTGVWICCSDWDAQLATGEGVDGAVGAGGWRLSGHAMEGERWRAGAREGTRCRGGGWWS